MVGLFPRLVAGFSSRCTLQMLCYYSGVVFRAYSSIIEVMMGAVGTIVMVNDRCSELVLVYWF